MQSADRSAAPDGAPVTTRRPGQRAPSKIFAVLVATVRAAAEGLLCLWVLVTAVFVALRVLPGDPTLLILGDHASPADRLAMRRTLHLDDSIFVQYARSCGRVLWLDFGESLRRPGVSVRSRLLAALLPTASLALTAVVLGGLLGVTAAALATTPTLSRFQRRISIGVDALASLPLLVTAPILTWLLAVRVAWLPLPGDPEAGLRGLLFAGGLLAIPLGAQVARFGIAALRSLDRAQFLTVARAKGAGPVRVAFVHAVAACSGAFLNVTAAQLGALLGGAVIIERMFERQGLGTLILEAYAARDLPVLEGAILVAGLLFVAVQMLATSAHALLDPRVRS
jgi:ABC-type dipeptide/oligopeptide/nickel transport system permease component